MLKNPIKTCALNYRASVTKLVFVLGLISLNMVPSLTNAGILSFFGQVLGTSEMSETPSFTQSSVQNIPLLEPATAIDPSIKPTVEIALVGNDALLPEVGPSTLPPDKADNYSGQISVYTVRAGDTVSDIAKMYDVSANTILWANDLPKSSSLKTGQNLVILPMSGVMHTVIKGDTLQSIAKKYGGNLDEIALYNDLHPNDLLALGTTVIVPDGEMSSPVRPSTVSSSNQTSRLIASAGGPDLGNYYQKPFAVGRKTQGLHGYNGVDYGMPVGTEIYAAAKGIVIISKNSGYNGGYGNYVVIQHPNNTQTVYGHLTNTIVAVGQTVKQGQLIGYSGNTGKSTGPHLHFEVRGAKNPF